MPWSPLKLCAHPSCSQRIAVNDRHCVVHARVATREREQRRGPRTLDGESLSGGGRSGFWRALRSEVLERDPICRDCKKERASHADHVLPKRDGGRDELSNLKGLCHRCHSRKTAKFDGGFGNSRKSGTTIGAASRLKNRATRGGS